MNVVAHEDDGLLFLSPDLVHDVQSSRCVHSVFVTAGDAGNGTDYWLGREAGIRAAYARLAGVANAWSTSDAGVSGHPIPLLTLTGRPSVSVAFLRLPDGIQDGSGSASNHFESLQKLWQGSITHVRALDGSSAYSKPALSATLTTLMDALQPDTIRTQDYTIGFGTADHSDHVATALFARQAHLGYATPHLFIGYQDYLTNSRPQNVFDPDLTAKTNAFNAYLAFDSGPCGNPPNCGNNDYTGWLKRQYRAGSEATQTITFAPLADRTFGDADFTISATSTSNLTVAFDASGNCTVSGTTVGINGAGACTITASQPGNANYNAAASVPRTFQIAKANQAITINTHAPSTAAGGSSFPVAASAPGGSITYTSAGACTNTGSLFGAAIAGGNCTVKYDQGGSADYNAAPQVTESVTVTVSGQRNQAITFGALANKTYGDADFGVGATASSGLAVSFAASGSCTVSGATVHITAAGSCTITASQAGDASYNSAPSVSQSLTIAKAGQTITFTALPDTTLLNPDFTLAATASSGLAVSYSASGSCIVAGAIVHLTSAGSCTITASQAGDANYNAATSVSGTFKVTSLPVATTICAVPKVVGERLGAAKIALGSRHCRTGTVRQAYSKKVKKGIVISQSRRAGQKLPANTKVNLVVSKGRANGHHRQGAARTQPSRRQHASHRRAGGPLGAGLRDTFSEISALAGSDA
jgi:LmbE family N-acetylglucosaminyl deacetylase